MTLKQEEVSDRDRERPFRARRLKYYLSQWREIKSDPSILKMVSGAEMPLEELCHLKQLQTSQSRDIYGMKQTEKEKNW